MSDFSQASFKGGINLLVDDTRLASDEYREAFNVRNRFDVLDQVREAVEDVTAPAGNKQGLYTFGEFKLLFNAGSAYYQRRGTTGWTNIAGFRMDAAVARYFVATVPVSTTNYARFAFENAGDVQPNGGVVLGDYVASVLGDVPGLLVQDGVNQPVFLFLDSLGNLQLRITQTYNEWLYDPTGVNDKREYVPVGTFMEWWDGILCVVATDGKTIFRSVSGRPLDFVINVKEDGDKAGNASTTSFGVGVGGITCIKELSDGSLFVHASGACYSVSINRNSEAPTIFGEPTFVRQFLFSATCLSEKVLLDILGDTAFIDPEGLRSFNAILQQKNEGRNSVFSMRIAPLFKGLLQNAATTAAISFDNYALFSVNTIYGPAIAVFDTLSQSFSSIDQQTTAAIKQFAKIDTDVTELHAITTDNKVYKLYSNTTFATSTVRFQGMTAKMADGSGGATSNPQREIRMKEFRCLLNNFRVDSTVTVTTFVNNRLSGNPVPRTVRFVTATPAYTASPSFADVGSQLANLTFPTPNVAQGWKAFVVLSWTGGGSITNIAASLEDLTPASSLTGQGVVA